MEVLVAKHAGFCFGVERAIDIVKDAAEKHEKVVTFGPIIHNPQVVSELAEKGVCSIKGLEDIKPDMAVIIRSHGIEKQISEALEEKSHSVIDASCPFVRKAQKAAEELSDKCGYVVILGESDHPEVKGIISYIKSDYTVIESIDDIDKLPPLDSCGFLAQTTQNNRLFSEIAEKLKDRCGNLVAAKTICNATDRRQEAALEVASKAEVMIVIGGKNSANTTRLYRLCKDICPKTYHVETLSELDKEFFINAATVGITAGASTPVELVAKVREYILEVAG